jgi:hypothetical protein
MATKNSPFVLYKTFIDAYMKGHPEVAKVVCNSLIYFLREKNIFCFL